ncbi:FimB/Mfa2 family fimbrial subunit, partial [Porphyromonas endodontalis]
MKSIYKLLGGLPLMVVSLLGLTSCDKWIYENFEDCPQAIKVGFYSKTECANQKSYPQRVTRLNIYAFDKNDVLYSTHVVDNVRLSKAYEYSIPVEKPGLYTVLSWGNLGDHYYDIGKVQVGKTTKQNILFRLRQTGKWGADLRETTLWYGESPVVQVERNTTNYERYTETSVNLREYTNRIAVIIEGVPNPEDYKIEIASSNGTYQVNGRVAKADSTFYPGETKVVGDSTCRADFTTLK